MPSAGGLRTFGRAILGDGKGRRMGGEVEWIPRLAEGVANRVGKVIRIGEGSALSQTSTQVYPEWEASG